MIITFIILAWLLAGEALFGVISYDRFLRAQSAGDTGARLRLYRTWIATTWLLTIMIIAHAATSPDFSLGGIGLNWPSFHELPGVGGSMLRGLLIGAIVAPVVGAMLGIYVQRTAKRQPNTGSAGEAAPPPKVMELLPRTDRERRGFAVLSITVGVCEEIVWRGFLIAALVMLFPSVSIYAIIGIAAVLFGIAHAYQGVSGIVATGIIGLILGGIYFGTGSVLVPIGLHVLLNLRALLVPVSHRAA